MGCAAGFERPAVRGVGGECDFGEMNRLEGGARIGAFLGALAAGRIAQSHRPAFAGGIVGLAVIGSIINWVSFTHPLWFIVIQLIGYPLVFLVVARMLPTAEQ